MSIKEIIQTIIIEFNNKLKHDLYVVDIDFNTYALNLNIPLPPVLKCNKCRSEFMVFFLGSVKTIAISKTHTHHNMKISIDDLHQLKEYIQGKYCKFPTCDESVVEHILI